MDDSEGALAYWRRLPNRERAIRGAGRQRFGNWESADCNLQAPSELWTQKSGNGSDVCLPTCVAQPKHQGRQTRFCM